MKTIKSMTHIFLRILILCVVWLCLILTARAHTDEASEAFCFSKAGKAYRFLDTDIASTQLSYRIKQKAKALGIQSIRVQTPEMPSSPQIWPRIAKSGHPSLSRALHHESLKAVFFVLHNTQVGSKYNVRRRISKNQFIPISVRWGTERVLYISEGPQGTPYADEAPTLQEIQQQFQLGELGEDGEATWTLRRREMLHMSLSMLHPTERWAVRNVTVMRAPDLTESEIPDNWDDQHGTIAGFYAHHGDGHITLLDTSFRGDAFSFSGQAQQPKPWAVWTFIHEVGHALAHAPYRWAQASVTPFHVVNILEDYATLPGVQTGPTKYSTSSVGESFAESFALWHLDPETLQRCMPEVHDWFASGGHHAGIESALAQGFKHDEMRP